MTFGISAIGHVQIAVPRAREAACLHFYRSVLGLREIPKPEELRSRGGAWFDAGNMELHIGVDPEASPPSKRHVCFLVADLAAARAAAVANGAVIEDDAADEGMPRFFLRDPAGNRLEFAEG